MAPVYRDMSSHSSPPVEIMIGADWVKSLRAPHSSRWTHRWIGLLGSRFSETRRIPLQAISSGNLHLFDQIAVNVQQIGLRH